MFRRMMASGLVLFSIFGAAPHEGRPQTVTAKDLKLAVDDAGRVTQLDIAGTDVMGQSAPAALVEMADVTRGPEFVAGTRTGGDLAAGLELAFEGLDAGATVTAQALEQGAVRFTCRLVGKKDAPARGVVLRFALPVDAVGWQWYDDMQTSRAVEDGKTYENIRPLREWPDLPEWADRPSLRMGSANRNFTTVLTGPVGLALAVPIDRPCIFRTAYDAQQRRLHLVYDLALSPDTLKPNEWTFEFGLYPCDPAWGFRGALDGYYRLHPELFANHVKQPGQWMAFSKLSQIDNVNEFLFGVQWGAPEVAYDDKIDVPSVVYLTHAGQFANIPDHNPETDPLPGHDVLLKAMTEAFRRTTGVEDMFAAVALYDVEGKADIRKTRAYGHIISQFNLTPQLPYGKWLLEQATRRTEGVFERTGGRLDGFGYDGLCSGLNYRAEHFRYSVAPPIWDPVAKKPVLNNHFDSCAFARAAAESFRAKGQISIMNGSLHASCFVAPWLDIFGAETGLRISREAFNYVRSISRHKPVVTLLKGNYEQTYGRGEIELFMKRALAYGIFPGFFDWFTSALGPGGRYWDHPPYYERDRDLFRKYLPLVQTLATAGWEPITHARAKHPRVFVERFGPDASGIVWLTLLNEDAQPYATCVTVDAANLQLADDVECEEILDGQVVTVRRDGRQLELELDVEGNGVKLLRLSTPMQAAAWRLGQAGDVVARGIRMREVDADKPAVAVSWHTTGAATYDREPTDDGFCMVMQGARGAQSAWQWAMLFQKEPAPVTLRVRAAGENLEGKGALRIRARHAWVSPSFSHYENAYLDLPKGTYDYQDFELTITPTEPLRAIYLQPEMAAGVTGTLRIASITLEDRFGDDYVRNPRFSEWYEPVPEAMRKRLATESQALGDAVEGARKAVLEKAAKEAIRKHLATVGEKTTALRNWIDQQKAQNGCRRVLRDVETVEHYLGLVMLASLGLAPPTLEAPSEVVAGDAVPVRVCLAAPADVPVCTHWQVEGAAAESDVTARPDGSATLHVRKDAKAGDHITLRAEVRLGPTDSAVPIAVSRNLVVVPALQADLSTVAAAVETGALEMSLKVRSHFAEPKKARVELTVPAGWSVPEVQEVELEPGQEKTVQFLVKPSNGAQAGRVELAAEVFVDDYSARAATTALHIPPAANRVRNPGFEDGKTAWSCSGDCDIDADVAHHGKASLRLRNAKAGDSAQASQTVTLNQKEPAPVLVRAASRGENVAGAAGRKYSLYVDIYYTDGTPLYGQVHTFPTGTSPWQVGELVIRPEKPIRNVNIYLLLRNTAGAVWFDDVAMMEDTAAE